MLFLYDLYISPDVNTGAFAYPCAGAVIARRVILTAAHCALAKADGHRL